MPFFYWLGFFGGDVRADNRLPCSASGVFHKCYGSKVTAEGHYKGTWQDDRFHGEGTLTYADGDTYIGGFKDGKQDGKGTQIYANGDRYIGEWRNGNKDGKGTQIYANGDKYIGEWRNGNKDGKATQIYANGDIYVGEWSESKKSGDGRLIYADGDKHEDIIKRHAQDHLDNPAPPCPASGVFHNCYASKVTQKGHYKGMWQDGRFHGKGMMTYADGDKYVGEWFEVDIIMVP